MKYHNITYIVQHTIIPQMAKVSAAITPVFRVTWSFRNHFDMLIWWSKKMLIINVDNGCAA